MPSTVFPAMPVAAGVPAWGSAGRPNRVTGTPRGRLPLLALEDMGPVVQHELPLLVG